MTIHTGFLVFAATACIWPVKGQDPPKAAAEKPEAKEPSAREMFWSRQMPYGIQNEKPTPARSANRSTGASAKPKPAPPAPVVSEDAAVTSHATQGSPQADHAAQIVPVAYSPGVPLGLRYTLRQRDGDKTTDVSADTEFHTGDHIQLNVEVNDTGYLYIVSQGTSHTWTALFPSPKIENGDNRVQSGHVYTVPPGHVFTFSGDPGPEKLFVIFSRQPVQEIDSLIYSLKGGHNTPTAAPGRERPANQVLEASARPIQDTEIARMRAAYSRDLIIEKGDQEDDKPAAQSQGGSHQDKSVYVVNPNGSVETRVVADITLKHE
ncbi:MAG: DUF4384 domain-containing protein [Bryobacteraceae bacterium]|jgi:hypothetical protein